MCMDVFHSQFACYDVCVHYLCIPLQRCLCWMEHSCRRERWPLLWEQPSMSHSKGIHTSSSGKGIGEQIVSGQLSLHILYISGTPDSHLWGRPQRWQKEKLQRPKGTWQSLLQLKATDLIKKTDLEVGICLQGCSGRIFNEFL